MKTFRILSVMLALTLMSCSQANEEPVDTDLALASLVNDVTAIPSEPEIIAESDIFPIEDVVNFLDSWKGPKARRENIPSEDIYASIEKHSKTYGIDPSIIVGLVIRESNVAAAPKDSSANCRGMCQISKYALDDFNTKHIWKIYRDERKFYTWEDMYDYDKNIEVACWYIRWLWNNYDDINDVSDVLICYNVGHGNLAKYKQMPQNKYYYHLFVMDKAEKFLEILA